MLEEGNVSLDILLYNPTNEPITVVVDRIGYQAPYENNLSYGITDWTTTNWACLQAWADYMQFNLESNKKFCYILIVKSVEFHKKGE